MIKREIKFRAWDGEEMFDAFCIKRSLDGVTLATNETWKDRGFCLPPTKVSTNYMQYTGFKDGNGIEIYEGDIVEFRANYSSKPCGYMNAVVEFDGYQWVLTNENGSYSIAEETDEFEGYKSKVLGNIFETPELIPTVTAAE